MVDQSNKNLLLKHKLDSLQKEYEEFAYIVSHDLGAPLRHVREFTRLLLDSPTNESSDEREHYRRYIEQSLQRLADMQDALLQFSRVNTNDLATDIDCNALVTKIIHQSGFDETLYTVTVDPLPHIQANPTCAEQLFSCLIDNAKKFHAAENKDRTIHISSKDEGDSWLFEIRDNGIGIEEKHHDIIFRFFHRLHPKEYEGVGAGLTLAQKLIQNMNGELLIESAIGRGTSAFFVLPK